jgi:hypothetical protein|nr:MAG TPA: hypothetical protein [Caudoviricetes sp.]
MLTPRQSIIATTAGPNNWQSLFSNDHANVDSEAAFPLLNTSIKQECTSLESAFSALAGYAGAAIILAYCISEHSTRDARTIFLASKRTAAELTELNGHTPVPHKEAISAINKILYSDNTELKLWLLVDIIRIANHITKG